jgi:glycosyltransferase involved in cell wall biosynthesis
LLPAHGESAAQHAAMRVAVLLDGASWSGAGSQFASWQRVAEAARGLEAVELSLHLLGNPGAANVLADDAPTRMHQVSLGSWCLPLRHAMSEQADGGWIHPAMLAQLSRCDVIHTIDAGAAAARTAAFARALWRMAMVTSLHTPLDGDRDGAVARATSWWPGRARRTPAPGPRLLARVHHKRRAHARRCDWVLTEHAHGALAPLLGHGRCSVLRRGLDRARFHVRARDRVRLRRQLGIPVTAPVLCFAGPLRADAQPALLARAVRELSEAGHPLHVIFVGTGTCYDELAGEVRARGHFPGTVSQDTLAWLLASSDLFAFPSPDAAVPSVVLEAMSCGTPVIAAPGGCERVIRHGVDGLVLHASAPTAWAAAIGRLLDDASSRLAMGRAAQAAMQRHIPSWQEVLEEDLLPVWQAAAQRALARSTLV